jgi:hypothetical protein
MATLPEARRQQVFLRANDRCEYCQTARRLIGMPLVVDYIYGWHPPQETIVPAEE